MFGNTKAGLLLELLTNSFQRKRVKCDVDRAIHVRNSERWSKIYVRKHEVIFFVVNSYAAGVVA
jgi:hypothetical protein